MLTSTVSPYLSQTRSGELGCFEGMAMFLCVCVWLVRHVGYAARVITLAR